MDETAQGFQKPVFTWGTTQRYYQASAYYRSLFGERVQKLSVEAGFTCPNRDGKVGRGGCTYCNNDAFNPSYCHPDKSIAQQLQEGIKFHRNRYRRANKYLAYFQAYTNTYAPLDELKKKYEEALTVKGVTGLIIATRPDCVDEDILDYLVTLSHKVFVGLEYGIESCYDKTLARVNRGHTFDRSVWAVKETAERGLPVGGHLILGLPGESRQEMLAETTVLSSLPLVMIKLHQLQIMNQTRMAKDYRNHPDHFDLFSWEEYREFIIDFVERLRPSIAVERLVSEAPPKFLITPGFGRRRTDVLMQEIMRRMEERNTWQGRLYATVKEKSKRRTGGKRL